MKNNTKINCFYKNSLKKKILFSNIFFYSHSLLENKFFKNSLPNIATMGKILTKHPKNAYLKNNLLELNTWIMVKEKDNRQQSSQSSVNYFFLTFLKELSCPLQIHAQKISLYKSTDKGIYWVLSCFYVCECYIILRNCLFHWWSRGTCTNRKGWLFWRRQTCTFIA